MSSRAELYREIISIIDKGFIFSADNNQLLIRGATKAYLPIFKG